MSNKEKTVLVPKLRFPEFWDSGEWTKRTLGQLGKLVSGLTYSPDDVRETGLLVLRSSNIKNGVITLDDNVYVRTDISGANLSLEGDILICVRNGSKTLIGKNAVIPKNMPLCTHGAFMSVLRAQQPQFVYQLLQTTAYERQVKADLGATINSINGTQLKKYVFCIPKEKQEQQKIADCLSSLDNLIAAEDKKLAALKLHKKGLMQKLFPVEGKTLPEWRFPEFRDSVEWEETTINSVFDLQDGYAFSSSDFIANDFNDAIQVIRITDINNKNRNNDKVYISKSFVIEKQLFKYTIQKNDLLLSLTGAAGFNFYIWDSTMAILNQRTLKIIPKNKSDDALKILLEPLIVKKININGTGQNNNLSKEVLKNTLVTLPRDPREQRKIADCLSSVDELITAQTDIIEALKAHKKGLMQGLFPSIEEVGE